MATPIWGVTIGLVIASLLALIFLWILFLCIKNFCSRRSRAAANARLQLRELPRVTPSFPQPHIGPYPRPPGTPSYPAQVRGFNNAPRGLQQATQHQSNVPRRPPSANPRVPLVWVLVPVDQIRDIRGGRIGHASRPPIAPLMNTDGTTT